MKHHETLVIQCDDRRSMRRRRAWRGGVGDRTEVIRCDDIGDRNGDVGDCGVGVTPQMCNRDTNHGDMGTFSKPGAGN